MLKQKDYKDLLFTDDFMFCKILMNNKYVPKRTRYYQGMIDLTQRIEAYILLGISV